MTDTAPTGPIPDAEPTDPQLLDQINWQQVDEAKDALADAVASRIALIVRRVPATADAHAVHLAYCEPKRSWVVVRILGPARAALWDAERDGGGRTWAPFHQFVQPGAEPSWSCAHDLDDLADLLVRLRTPHTTPLASADVPGSRRVLRLAALAC